MYNAEKCINSSDAPSITSKPTPVEKSLHELESLTNDLRVCLDVLIATLNPILTIKPEEKLCGEVSASSECELCGAINSHCWQIYKEIERIRDIKNRICL